MRKSSRNLVLAAAAALSIVTFASTGRAEMPHPDAMHAHSMAGHGAMDMPTNGPHDSTTETHGTIPTLPGQDAFGAIQEIIRILEADPKTDWSKVNIEALRQHLIDMNKVTLHAHAVPRNIQRGIEVAVTGAGRTLEAIRRMVNAHAHEINGLNGWTVQASPLPDGVTLTVTSANPKEVTHIRGLGFIGIMASGASHPLHHLAMAKGLMHMP